MLKEKRQHERCIPCVKIPENIALTESVAEALTDCDIAVMGVASPYVRATASKMKEYANDRLNSLENSEENEGEVL